MEVLRYLLVSLHDRLPVGDGLINYLYSNGLLKRNDVEELKRRRQDEAIDCLVTQILPFADSATFPVFCKALQMTNAEHALRPIRAVVETIVPHFQGIPPEILASSSVIIIVDISLRESFYREFPAIKDRLFASATVELIYANLAGFYRKAFMSTQNVHALSRKLVIVTGQPVAESHNLCNQIANIAKIDRNVVAYHCSQQRAWGQSQYTQSIAIQSQVLPPYHNSQSVHLHPSHSESNVQYPIGREVFPSSMATPPLQSLGGEGYHASHRESLPLILPSRRSEVYHSARHPSLPDARQLPSGMTPRRSDELSSPQSTSSTTPIEEVGSAHSSMTWQSTTTSPVQEQKAPSSMTDFVVPNVEPVPLNRLVDPDLVELLRKVPEDQLLTYLRSSLASGNAQHGQAQKARESQSATPLNRPTAPPVERSTFQVGETSGSKSSSDQPPIAVEQPLALQSSMQEPGSGSAHGSRSVYRSPYNNQPTVNISELQEVQHGPRPSQSQATPSEDAQASGCRSRGGSYVDPQGTRFTGSMATPEFSLSSSSSLPPTMTQELSSSTPTSDQGVQH